MSHLGVSAANVNTVASNGSSISGGGGGLQAAASAHNLGLRTQGHAMLQEGDWVAWLNHILHAAFKHQSKSGGPASLTQVANVGKDLANGVVFMHVLEYLVGHPLKAKYNAAPKNRIQQIDNVLIVFDVMQKEFATQIVGCTPYEVVDGNAKRIMGVLNSLAQVARKRQPSLPVPGSDDLDGDLDDDDDDDDDDEDDDDDDDDSSPKPQPAAAAVPPSPRDKVDQMKEQFKAGYRRRRDTITVDAAEVNTSISQQQKQQQQQQQQSASRAAAVAAASPPRVVAATAPAAETRAAAPAVQAPAPPTPVAVAAAPTVTVTATTTTTTSTSAVDGMSTPRVSDASAADVAAALESDAMTRKWKRLSNVSHVNTLGAYAARYKSTDEAAIAAAEAADRASLKPDDKAHYAEGALRIMVRTSEGSLKGEQLEVPVWIEPNASYDDVVRQLDARIWSLHGDAAAKPHQSNRRRSWNAPLVLYVSTQQRGMLGCLADVGDELLPHAIASALADEGDDAVYDYRELTDDPSLLESASDAAVSEKQRRKERRRKKKVQRAAAAAAANADDGDNDDAAAAAADDSTAAAAGDGAGSVVRAKRRAKIGKKKKSTSSTANADDDEPENGDDDGAEPSAAAADDDEDGGGGEEDGGGGGDKKPKKKKEKSPAKAWGNASASQGLKRRSLLGNARGSSEVSATSLAAEAAKADETTAEQNEDAALAAEATRRALKRNEIAREVLTSERRYVQDGLDVLLAMYLEPLRSNGLISKDEIKLIFGDIEAIRNYNSLLLDQLEKRMKQWEESQQMGDIFLSAIPFLKVYTVYVNKYNNALETLVECRTKNKKFTAFLEKQMTSARCAGLDIGAYLIMPIQRIPRYVMLLQELLRYTEPAHTDYVGLQEAYTKMRDVADYVNERKREAENLAQVGLVAKLITGTTEPVAAPHRRFVTQAALGVAVTPSSYDATVDPKPYFVVLFNDMLVFAKTNAKIRKGKGAARSVQLTTEEQVEECDREHKYVARVLLQHYGLVDGQALTATGGGNDVTADTAANDVGWDIVTVTTPVKKKSYPDIASHCLRLEPLLPVHELPLAPETSADGFLPRAFYRLYMSSEEEKRVWARALDDALCALLESEASRRLDTIKLQHYEVTPALAKAAYENPDKRGTLWKLGKDGTWNERLFVLHGPLLFYCKPTERADAARAIDVRFSSVRLAPRDSAAAKQRSFSIALQTPERLVFVAPADVAGAEVECFQWIFALRAATTRHVCLAPDTSSGTSKPKRRGADSDTLRRADGHLRALDEILRHEHNLSCHDCSHEATNWVSMTSGAVLCDACASVHVQLPKGVSQVRSIGMSKWDDESVVQFRQANLAVLKRLRTARGADAAPGAADSPVTPRSDMFAVAANEALKAAATASGGSPAPRRELRRPAPNAPFAVRSAYIGRLYCSLAGARKPAALTPLDSMDGFLWRRPNATAAWRRETFRLRGTNLDFEKAKALGHTVESVSLQAAEIRAPRNGGDRPFAFDLVTPTRLYSLAADDQDDMCRWCLAIQFSVDAQK